MIVEVGKEVLVRVKVFTIFKCSGSNIGHAIVRHVLSERVGAALHGNSSHPLRVNL